MERHEALQDLSRDHYRCLLRAKRAGAAEGEEVDAEAARFLGFAREDLALHLQEEEHVLQPVLVAAGWPRGDERLHRLEEEHDTVRERVEALDRAVEAGAGVAERLGEAAEALRRHVRWEERTLFPRVQEVLGEDALKELHSRSAAFRTRFRGPDAVGPGGHAGDL